MKIKLYKPFEHWYHGGVIWIYSDPHFEDEDCKLIDRNWPSPEEQVKIINSKVGKKDTLIILGDIGNLEWIKKLKGYKVLVMGNHDKGASNYLRRVWIEDIWQDGVDKTDELKAKPDFNYIPGPKMRLRQVAQFDNRLFDEVYEGPVMINDKILLSHEPLSVPCIINIHGHSHGAHYHVLEEHHEDGMAVSGTGFMINMVSNMRGFEPVRLDKLIEDVKVDDIHRSTIDGAIERKMKKFSKK